MVTAQTRHYLSRTVAVPIGYTRGEWRDGAACASHPTLPPSTWDDSLYGETDVDRILRVRAAIKVCSGCPVSAECVADTDRRWDEGIRGGVDLRALYRAQDDAAERRRGRPREAAL